MASSSCLACDLRVLADDAVLSLPESRLGLPLTWGGLASLVREVGPAVAKDLVLTGRGVDAAEAQALGLATRVVPPDRLGATADALAADLATRARLVVADTVTRADAAAAHPGARTEPEQEADLLVAAMADPECLAARASYLAAGGRRPPAATAPAPAD